MFSKYFQKKKSSYQMSSKSFQWGAKRFHANGQTHGHDEAIGNFSSFWKHAENGK
jgi:hypothetical protein